MSKTYEEWLKYYKNATKEQIIEEIEHDNLEIERLKERIDKAIEYIEKRKQEREKANKYAYDIRNDDFIKYCNIELDILKGDESNEKI